MNTSHPCAARSTDSVKFLNTTRHEKVKDLDGLHFHMPSGDGNSGLATFWATVIVGMPPVVRDMCGGVLKWLENRKLPKPTKPTKPTKLTKPTKPTKPTAGAEHDAT